MGLVNQHQVIFVSIPDVVIVVVKHFRETAIAYKASILFESKVMESRLPVLFYGRRVNNQNLRMFWAVLNQKLLGNHRGNNCLAETHHICEEETVIAYQLLIALYYGICLIVKLAIALRHIEGVILVDGQYAVAEVFHQHLDIQLIGGDVTLQVSLIECGLIVLGIDGHILGLFPQQFKLVFGKLHIVVLRQFDVELVLSFFCDTQAIAAQIATAGNGSAKAMLVVIVGIENVDFCMNLLRGMGA